MTKRAFADGFLKLRLEMPSQKVDLASLTDASGARVYPDAVAPPAGPVSIGELKAVNDRQLLLIERDNLGDDLPAPRFKKVFLLDTSRAAERAATSAKTLLVDLLAIPDPSGVGGDGDFFRLPFYTIESVHVVDERTLLVASDNNFPFSNGRSRSRSADRGGPLAADATEIILVRLGTPLDVDRRLLPAMATAREVAPRDEAESLLPSRPIARDPGLGRIPATRDRSDSSAAGIGIQPRQAAKGRSLRGRHPKSDLQHRRLPQLRRFDLSRLLVEAAPTGSVPMK